MKRLRSERAEADRVRPQDVPVVHDTIAEDFMGAAALLGLSHCKLLEWPTSVEGELQDHERRLPASRPEQGAAKTVRHISKAARTSHNTRSYVWRGPHRGALALRKKQLQQEQHILDPGHVSDGNSSRRSSTSGAAASDEEVLQQPEQQEQAEAIAEGPYASARQRDKEWAALTTWLRMNLHHPRTVKKLVLFVGEQDVSTGSWKFCLNPGLTWDDVSVETRLRLKTLSIEAEQAFLHKYPDRSAAEWGSKVQKYRPAGSSTTVNVCLKDMVASLSSIYFEHEPQEAAQNRKPHSQAAEQPKMDDQQPNHQGQQAEQLHRQQPQELPQPHEPSAELHQQRPTELPQPQEAPAQPVHVEQSKQQQVAPPPVLGVPVGLSYVPSAAVASAVPAMFPGWGYMSAYPHWQTYFTQLQQQQLQMSASAATFAGTPVVGVPADVAAAGAATGADLRRQTTTLVMQQPMQASDLHVQKQVLPDVVVAAGDGTDSCAESATPVAAQTSLVFAAAC